MTHLYGDPFFGNAQIRDFYGFHKKKMKFFFQYSLKYCPPKNKRKYCVFYLLLLLIFVINIWNKNLKWFIVANRIVKNETTYFDFYFYFHFFFLTICKFAKKKKKKNQQQQQQQIMANIFIFLSKPSYCAHRHFVAHHMNILEIINRTPLLL